MKTLSYLPWVALGALMILHGIAHMPAVLGSWELATFEDVSYQPTVLFTNADDELVRFFGGIWLLAAMSYVVAGIGVIRQAFWWPTAAAMAIVLSLPMTMLWADDAVIGLLLNAVILAILGSIYLVGMRQEQELA